MVSNLFSFERTGLAQADLAIVDKSLQETRVVNHLVCSAELGVFVLEDIEAVRTGRDDLFDPVVVQCLNVLVGHHLEKKLVAGTACGIARTHFFGAEDGIVDADLIENGGEGLRDALRALIEAACASHPKQDVRGLPGGRHFCHCSYLHSAPELWW
jgi:hypothetical protein